MVTYPRLQSSPDGAHGHLDKFDLATRRRPSEWAKRHIVRPRRIARRI